MPLRLGLVGIGAIARNEHLPEIERRNDVTLVAAASRNARIDGVPNYPDIAAMLDAEPSIEAVALTAPPEPRFAMAREALRRGRHVMLEKPPGATLSEVEMLAGEAREAGVTLHASWHSRHAAAVEAARLRLESATIRSASIVWREDVRRWHPGQEWIWEAGGFGVFDPGINALSIATHVLPRPFRLVGASLVVPAGRQTPISAQCEFDASGAPIAMDLDWTGEGRQTREMTIETASTTLVLSDSGAKLSIDGEDMPFEPAIEYSGVYDRFTELVDARQSEVDTAPLRHVADAMLLGRRETGAPFEW